MLILDTPTKLRIEGYDDRRGELEEALTFSNKKAIFELRKFRKATWYLNKYGEEAYNEKLNELRAAQRVSLLFEDEKGLYTHAGLKDHLASVLRDYKFENRVVYPEPNLIPWARVPKHELRYYQKEIVDALCDAKHGAVEVGTGLGKSKCILHQTKRLGVQTLIMAPSTSIARQLYDDFKYHFGSKYVGLVGDGSKDYKKDIVIGIAASLTRIEKGSEAWGYLSKTQFFAADESHLTPAETFARVCLGLVEDAPYRAFYSATQMRNDGGELLLRGIIGPVVYRMTVREGVDQGFLAMPHFKMIPVVSRSTYFRDDPMEMARKHFLYNKDVAKIAADVANKAVGLLNHQVVILVDEVEQLALLLPHFRYEVGFAHGGLTKENKGGVDPRFHESNVKELVQRFNDGNLPILVGTSCINTGTDIRPVKTIINLQAGRSEIKFRQSVGRGTRLVEGKTDFNFVDFAVRCANVFENESQDILWRHAHQRAAIYEDLYPNVTWLFR